MPLNRVKPEETQDAWWPGFSLASFTCSATVMRTLASKSLPSSFSFTLLHTPTARGFCSWRAGRERGGKNGDGGVVGDGVCFAYGKAHLYQSSCHALHLDWIGKLKK